MKKEKINSSGPSFTSGDGEVYSQNKAMYSNNRGQSDTFSGYYDSKNQSHVKIIDSAEHNEEDFVVNNNNFSNENIQNSIEDEGQSLGSNDPYRMRDDHSTIEEREDSDRIYSSDNIVQVVQNSSEGDNHQEDVTNEDNIQDDREEVEEEQASPTHKYQRKRVSNQYGMERISEVDNEDEKYTTVIDKMEKDVNTDQYRIDESNIDFLMQSSINSKNLKNYYAPIVYNSEKSNYKFRPEINENSKRLANDRNKSSDTIKTGQSKGPIEVDI